MHSWVEGETNGKPQNNAFSIVLMVVEASIKAVRNTLQSKTETPMSQLKPLKFGRLPKHFKNCLN